MTLVSYPKEHKAKASYYRRDASTLTYKFCLVLPNIPD